MEDPAAVGNFSAFSVKMYIPFLEERCFLVVPNWFRRTEAANDDTRISSALVGSPTSNLSVIPVCLRNVHHLYQLPD